MRSDALRVRSSSHSIVEVAHEAQGAECAVSTGFFEVLIMGRRAAIAEAKKKPGRPL